MWSGFNDLGWVDLSGSKPCLQDGSKHPDYLKLKLWRNFHLIFQFYLHECTWELMMMVSQAFTHSLTFVHVDVFLLKGKKWWILNEISDLLEWTPTLSKKLLISTHFWGRINEDGNVKVYIYLVKPNEVNLICCQMYILFLWKLCILTTLWWNLWRWRV